MQYFISLCCLIYYVTSAIMEIPSIVRVLRRKSSTDYSLAGIWLNMIATVSWSIYIYTSEQTVLVYIGTTTDFIMALVYTVIMIKYHDKHVTESET